ncbi:MAG TPA: hypothetical protein VK203_10340 [Nostocaceae cyanobacterium]|nr:hypothetical protein [Nostocaceae cyanobacterium]
MTKNTFRLLLSLLIISCLSVGCQGKSSDTEDLNNSVTANKTTKKPLLASRKNLESSELQKTYKDFDKSLNNFLAELQKVANEQNELAKKIAQDQVDTQTINTKLEALIQVNKNLLAQAKTQELKDSHNDIDTTLGEIQKIVKPLNRGLTTEGIKQVQELLKLTKQDRVKRNVGKFGNITNTAIKESLNNFNINLRKSIQEVETGKPETPIDYNPNRETVEQLNAENTTLLAENQNLKTEIEKIKAGSGFSGVSFFTGALSSLLAVLMFFIYKKFRTSKNNPDEQLRHNVNYKTNHYDYPPDVEEPDHNRITLQNKPSISRPNSAIHPPTPATPTIHTPPYTPPSEPSKNPSNIVAEVAETEESINQRRLGYNQAVILEKVGRGKGNYEIIDEGGIYYLIPKKNLKITEYNYETIQALFDCPAYQPTHSEKFAVIQPAKVTQISQNEWQLIEYGILRF